MGYKGLLLNFGSLEVMKLVQILLPVLALVSTITSLTSSTTSIKFYWVLICFCPNLIDIRSVEETLAKSKHDVVLVSPLTIIIITTISVCAKCKDKSRIINF